tara:strand:+ start:1068 stop:1289 length:222 start_codon:yes stop_codon:yes gene_type:complete
LHKAEQNQARARDILAVAEYYYDALTAGGISADEAIDLTQRLELLLWQGDHFDPQTAFNFVIDLLSDLETGQA